MNLVDIIIPPAGNGVTVRNACFTTAVSAVSATALTIPTAGIIPEVVGGYVMCMASTDCYVRFGLDVATVGAATTNDFFWPAGLALTFKIMIGQHGAAFSVIQKTAGGTFCRFFSEP